MTKNLNPLAGTRDVVALRVVLGAVYGVVAGLAFASATWGWDGYLLSKTYTFLPWLKLLVGAVLCIIAGGLAGWATIRHEKWWVALLSWLGVTFVFTWLVIAVPLQISPLLSGQLQPELRGFIHIHSFDEVIPRFWLAFVWVVIFVSIVGLLEIVLVESTVFASSFIGRVSPSILCIVIMVICGTIVDGLNNEPLRRALLAMDSTTRFVLDHRGQVVDKAVSRANHASALRVFTEDLSDSYDLLVGEYDVQLGEVIVLVNFENLVLDCTVLYGQPAFCKPAKSP